MLLRRTAAAAVGLLALLPTLTACGDDGAELAVGDIVPARESDQFANGSPSFLVLPTGRLEVQLGEILTRIDAGDTRELADVVAPPGSTFVPITWQYDVATFMEHADYLGDSPSPVIDLVTEGAEYRISSPSEEGAGSESFYVLVNGSGMAPALKVEFDGVAQTVDLTTGTRDPGEAVGLYDIKTLHKQSRSCAAGIDYHEDDGQPQLTCTIGKVTALPYAAGSWAAKGRVRLAFSVTTELIRYLGIGESPGSGAFYYAESVKSTFKVGGRAPTSVTRSPQSLCPDPTNASCSDVHLLVVDAPQQARPRLVINLVYALRAVTKWAGYDGSTRLRLRATARASIR